MRVTIRLTERVLLVSKPDLRSPVDGEERPETLRSRYRPHQYRIATRSTRVTGTSAALLPIHRLVRVCEQGIRVDTVGGEQGQANRRADADGDVAERMGPLDLIPESRQHLVDLSRAGLVRQHDCELVSAQARDDITRAERPLHSCSGLDQHEIAVLVAMGVVDRLEAVEIDEEEGARFAAARCGRDRVTEEFREQRPVREARERIVERLELRRRRWDRSAARIAPSAQSPTIRLVAAHGCASAMNAAVSPAGANRMSMPTT
jgi:hypothetical protein